jgi:hypothetical protein
MCSPPFCVALFSFAQQNDMLLHREAWRLETDVTGVAEQWQHFSSELKVKMTQIRSQNKTIVSNRS